MIKTLKHITLNLSVGILVVLFILHPGLILHAMGAGGTFGEQWRCGVALEMILTMCIAIMYALGRSVTDFSSEMKKVKKVKKK